MLVTKTVQIVFANSEWNVVEFIQDIRQATKSASLNLFSKYDVRLEIPRVVNDSQVIMDVRIPEDIVDTFSIGNHLRGVAAYLMKTKKDKYGEAVVGNRLFNYIVIPTPGETSLEISMSQRLSTVAEIVELMKNTDEISNDKIMRIIRILHEED